MAAALTAIVLAALVPHAAAGPLATVFTVQPKEFPTSPLVAETGEAVVKLEWSYTSQSSAGSAALSALREATLQWTQAECESVHVRVTGALQQKIDLWPGYPAAAPPSKVTGESTFTVTATRDAPGLQALACTFKGKVLSPQASLFSDSNEAVQALHVTVEYLGSIHAKVAAPLGEAGPQKPIAFAIEVQNLGNAQTQVLSELVGEPGPGWQLLLPLPVVLNARTTGSSDTQDVMVLLVQTPYEEGMNNGEQALTLRLTPLSTADSARVGPSVEVTVLARVRGLYCSDPVEPVPECKEAIDEIRKACQQDGRTEEDPVYCEALLAATGAKASPGPGLALVATLACAALLVRRRMPGEPS